MFKEREIGEIFTYDNCKIIVKKNKNKDQLNLYKICEKCIFSNICSNDIMEEIGICDGFYRQDKKDIYYKKANIYEIIKAKLFNIFKK